MEFMSDKSLRSLFFVFIKKMFNLRPCLNLFPGNAFDSNYIILLMSLSSTMKPYREPCNIISLEVVPSVLAERYMDLQENLLSASAIDFQEVDGLDTQAAVKLR